MNNKPTEEEFLSIFNQLKSESGSHSPSLTDLLCKCQFLKINIDACFLSNPYATDLFFEYLNLEVIQTDKLRNLLEFYPSQNRSIAKSLSGRIGIDAKNIFIGNGAIEIIQAIFHQFNTGRTLINIPTFSSYYEFIKDTKNVIFNQLKKEEHYKLNIIDFIKTVKEHLPDTIVLINPNNPDGNFIDSKNLELLLVELKDVKNVILDESFVHFANNEDGDYQLISSDKLISKYPNLILIKSLSKDFGIAGIRCGYAIMNEEKVNTLLNNGYLWNSNGIAEYFFRLYSQSDFFEKYNNVRIRYILETQEFHRQLKKIPNILIYSSQANFFLIELLNGKSASSLQAQLLYRYGIYVRNCEDKIGLEGEFLRIASRTLEQNMIIISALKEILQNT
jgi:histidinol-phosphate/aromatic aminotransferase/cobyric acid decarboxylase-like protein